MAKGLGKGLSALMGEAAALAASTQATAAVAGGSNTETPKTLLPIEDLTPGSFQPRRYFAEDSLRELAESIRKNGVMQPILVRPLGQGRYQIIAGERRWRASKIAGLTDIPTTIRDLSDREALEFALIENIQRQDLTPLEEADGYQRLLEEFSYTQEELASALGKSRSHIANMIRLLALPESVKQYVNSGQLSMGHARAILTAPNPEELAERIIREGLNVRQAERLAKSNGSSIEALPPRTKQTGASHNISGFEEKDEDVANLEQTLSENLGMKVKIEDSEQGGRVTIFFHNLEQLDTILQRLSGSL